MSSSWRLAGWQTRLGPEAAAGPLTCAGRQAGSRGQEKQVYGWSRVLVDELEWVEVGVWVDGVLAAGGEDHQAVGWASRFRGTSLVLPPESRGRARLVQMPAFSWPKVPGFWTAKKADLVPARYRRHHPKAVNETMKHAAKLS
jgi:hypothetical protein